MPHRVPCKLGNLFFTCFKCEVGTLSVNAFASISLEIAVIEMDEFLIEGFDEVSFANRAIEASAVEDTVERLNRLVAELNRDIRAKVCAVMFAEVSH